VKPDLWIAPAHTFDENTIKALSLLGIRTISDGFHFRPHTDHRGVLWIPQQLGNFHRMPFGLWTVCIHLNDPGHADDRRFLKNIKRFRPHIVDVATVIKASSQRRTDLVNEMFASLLHQCKKAKAAQQMARENGV
jgi:hypothetical protein